MTTSGGQILLREHHSHNSAPAEEQQQQAPVEQSEQPAQPNAELREEIQVSSVQHPTQIEHALEQGIKYLMLGWVVLFVIVIIGVAIERSVERTRARK